MEIGGALTGPTLWGRAPCPAREDVVARELEDGRKESSAVDVEMSEIAPDDNVRVVGRESKQ
jgi:hypothetical protein